MNGASRINIKELLSKYKYYNIAVILMAFEGQTEHALHFFGEKETFQIMRGTMEYRNFIRNVDFSTYPISVDRKGCVIGPHYQIASAILAEKDEIFYMSPDVPGEYFDESWLGDYSKKEEIISFYQNLIAPELPQEHQELPQ